ncbi:cation efflux family-domain-containing protein [Coemansia mojavensis]|nr:cation efflux family-domain-containing protein [Coemansia mojavensis]
MTDSCHSGHTHHCCEHQPVSADQAPNLASKRSSSRVFYDAYGPAAKQLSTEHIGVSWRRIWRVLAKDHKFLGPQLYLALLHLALGVGLWTAGIYIESLALMGYAFIVIYNACSLFIALLPVVLEYSGNVQSTTEYPFGLQSLPTLLEFTNNITLLYRGVQALKEGVEHIVINGHEHDMSTMEFETYAHRAKGHNHDALLGMAGVISAMLATGLSAARFMNHHPMWEVRSRRRQLVTGMQNTLCNPYNASSLFAGLWMLAMLVLVPTAEESFIEPASCIVMAAIMAYTSFPTCMRLGKRLLCAVSSDVARDGQKVLWQISKLPGVLACTSNGIWSIAHDKHAIALRVSIAESADNQRILYEHIANLLRSSGFSEWTIEIGH